MFNINNVVVVLSLLCSPAAAGPNNEIFIDSYEGRLPDVTKYSLSGVFPDAGKFTLSIKFTAADTTVAVERGKRIFQTRLPSSAYYPLHLAGIVAMEHRASGQAEILVVIPHGDPQTDCFANGEEVFSQVTLRVRKDGTGVQSRRVFRECVAVYEED